MVAIERVFAVTEAMAPADRLRADPCAAQSCWVLPLVPAEIAKLALPQARACRRCCVLSSGRCAMSSTLSWRTGRSGRSTITGHTRPSSGDLRLDARTARAGRVRPAAGSDLRSSPRRSPLVGLSYGRIRQLRVVAERSVIAASVLGPTVDAVVASWPSTSALLCRSAICSRWWRCSGRRRWTILRPCWRCGWLLRSCRSRGIRVGCRHGRTTCSSTRVICSAVLVVCTTTTRSWTT